MSKFDNDREAEASFLKELSDLCYKYGVYIGGCGCCGSPFIGDITGECHGPYLLDHDSSSELAWADKWTRPFLESPQ